jgi:glycosyltransferase involved in cell wall biosynthesis
MKIAVSCLCDISKNDGTSGRAKRVFEVLQKKYDCTLILRGEHKSKTDNVEVIRPSKFWNFQLISVVLRNRFDLVYCSSDFWGFFTYFTLAKLRTCKVILEAHGVLSLEREERYPDPSPLEKIRIKILKWREKFAVEHADCVIALSQDISKFYSKFNKNIVIVQNFVDDEQFKPRERSRERISDDKGKKYVGLIGPFFQEYYINLPQVNSYFLDFVYKNIHKFDKRINFTIIGQCDYKIANDRISYTGYLSDFQDYVDQLTHLDAVLVPAKFSSFGALTKVLEPMACSVPVFTTPEGLVSFDHITPGEDILICDEFELVAKVNEYLFDIELMEKVGKNARSTLEKYYSKLVNGKQLIEVIDRVCPPD